MFFSLSLEIFTVIGIYFSLCLSNEEKTTPLSIERIFFIIDSNHLFFENENEIDLEILIGVDV